MKTQIKRFSKSALAVVLTLCMLVSCMTVGIIATDAAYDNSQAIGADKVYITYVPNESTYNNYWWFDGVNKKEMSLSSGTKYTYTFPTSGASLNANTTYRFQIMVGSAHYVVNQSSAVDNTDYQLYSYGSNDNHHSVNYATGDKSTITVTFDTNTNKIRFTSTAAATPLAAPTLKYNNSTNSPVTIGAGETATLTWAAVTNAASYDVYKDGSVVSSGTTTRSYSATSSGTYTVKAKPASGSTTYSESAASNEIKVNIPIEFYVLNSANWDFSKMKYYLYGGSEAAGSWEGTSMSGDSKTEKIGTSGGKNVYKVTIVTDDTHIILVETGSKQTKGDNATALANGKVYTTVAKDKDASTVSDFSDLVLDVSNSVAYTTGTGFSFGGTQPASAYSGTTVSFTVTPSSGYRIKSVKYTPTGGSATNCTAGSNNEYHFTMPNKAVTVSVETVQQFSVTLTADTGFDTKKYKVDSGTQQTYSTAITVDSGSKVVFDVTYTAGYEYDSTNSTLSGATASNSNKTFTLSSVTDNTTVTLAAKKITWSGLTAVGKYSTTAANDASYNNTFPAGKAPNVTIAATSATQLDGVKVTAPGTDPEGYVFAGWTATSGSFENGEDKDTTFYPTAEGAQAIAKYKKIFTITSSVDSTGTGAGTVSTSVATVVAGGSYTITSTAASGSAIESIKVNGSAVSSPAASKTISSVSADQTVVVKFKSNVYLCGGSTIGTNWTTGDAMTSNAAGTEFTKTYSNVAGSSSGTQYQFKLYVNGYNNDGTATINITGGASTGTCTHQSSGFQNYVLTLKKAANVTVKSNGTKITEIKVVPVNATKYAVTFKKADNTTITGQYEGTNFSTALADATVQVYAGDEISYEVKAADGYYIKSLDGVSGFTANTTYNGKLTVNAATTITPTVAQLLSITAKSNKSDRGTVTIKSNKSTVFPGEKITVIVSPKNGVLKTLTYSFVKNSVTYIFECNLTTKAWTQIQPPINNSSLNSAKLDVATVTALMYDFFNKSGDALGAVANDEVLGADTEYPLTLDSNATGNITVNATFDAYSAESEYYYNGYNSSGSALSGYHNKQMTEVMLDGVPYSYYEVTGRSGDSQLFTVSKGSVSGGSNGRVYFTKPSSNIEDWDINQNPHAYFMDSVANYPGNSMSLYGTNDYGEQIYYAEIPDGATFVVFNDGSGGHQTVDITNLSAGGYYIAGSGKNNDGKLNNIGTYTPSYPDAGKKDSSGTEYFFYDNGGSDNTSGIYTDDCSTTGFFQHGASSKHFAKPNTGSTPNYPSGDYYIIVLYPGNTYTINGVEKSVPSGSYPIVIWSENLPGDASENVTVYAKDGAIRADTFGSTYANIADTKIYLNDDVVGTDHSGNITNQTYQTYKAAKGDTIVIKTTIGATDSSNLSNAAALKAKYYVRGFCINGEVSELLEWNANGLYTLTYKVPEDYEGKNIEITPIYYLKDTEANPIVTYRVTGFTDELKAVGSGKPGWGDTLYTYPFYGKLGGQNNAFGAYPGQPMVYYKGQYQMQIPQKSTAWDPYQASASTVNNTTVSGVTMSNGYWDSVHKTIMGYGDNSSSADHVQTYDYGDFYKIFNEKKPVDNIVFDFKYRTKKHNFENQPAASTTKSDLDTNYGTNGNGFELLTNFHGRTVDLFGTPLSGEQLNATPVYVVSIGGVNGSAGVENIAGYYATEWMVYGSSNGSSYTRISAGGKDSIPPEVLVLNNNSTSFNDTTYPSADANHVLTNWKELYTALETYRGRPVMISYEAADAQQGQGMYYTGTGGATRNDGRWLYSKNGENITSKIKIQYSDDNGVTYTDLNTTTPQVTGLSAYFTNDGVEGEMTYSTTIDPDKTFDFEAKTTNANYKFVGWFMEDGTKITTDNASHTERSGSYTFVAKFMKVESGQLILSHSVDTNDTYKGAGTAKISAVVKNGDEVVRTYDLSTSDITLDDKIIKSDSTYTIEVTLEATATGNDALGTTVLANPSGQDTTYFNAASTTTSTDGKTKTIVLNSFTVASLFSGTTQSVKNIIYHSYFTQVTFHYDLLFEYTDRFGATKQFYRQGYLTAAQAANKDYVSVVQVSQTRRERRLLPAFIEQIAPHVSNFGEDIVWDIVTTGYAFDVQNYNYTLTNTILAIQTKTEKRNITFKLPYQHNDGIAVLNGNVGTAATTTNFALTGDRAVDYKAVPVLPNNGVNNIYTNDKFKNWIAAPAVITDDGTQKYFQYWSIASTSAVDREIERCYFNAFNYAALDNFVVTPIYDTKKTDISQSGIYTGVTYLETSRNQWNTKADSGKNDKDDSGNRIAADLLYNDFVINFNYKGAQLNLDGTDSAAVKDLGVVVERIQELDIKQDGTKDTDISKYTGIAKDENTVKNIINESITDKRYSKHSIAKKDLDNKNSYMLYDAFYNGAGWNLENQKSAQSYTYKNYVYRVYTYIKYTDENGKAQIVLSEVPGYFTMYDEAVKDYVAPKTSSTNP